MSVLIVGCDGSMGKRYQAILRYLGVDFMGIDLRHGEGTLDQYFWKSKAVIIATPTDTHSTFIRHFMGKGRPILCEKPVTKNLDDLRALMRDLEATKTPFRMVNQYRVLADSGRIGPSFYNYYRHGSDGLYWDCMQIIGLSRGEVKLGESSPVWRCKINGKRLHIEDMDAAYIAYIQKWFKEPNQPQKEIIEAHEKTAEMERIAPFG